MTPALFLTLALAPGADRKTGPPLPPTTVSPDAPYGYVYHPARDLDLVPRYPARRYDPQPGDVILMSDPDPLFTALYRAALTGKPGHAGIVARLPDGRLGVLEAGFNESLVTRFVPLDYRVNQYPGAVWVRQRRLPATATQDARLTEFAARANNTPYNLPGVSLNLTAFRHRGPLRTAVMGRPRGPGVAFYCSEAIVEALVYSGDIDPDTARPAATFPRDLFFDRSLNPYVNRHPPLAAGWEMPALWTPVPGWAAKGKDRPPVAGVVVAPPPTPAPRAKSRRARR